MGLITQQIIFIVTFLLEPVCPTICILFMGITNRAWAKIFYWKWCGLWPAGVAGVGPPPSLPRLPSVLQVGRALLLRDPWPNSRARPLLVHLVSEGKRRAGDDARACGPVGQLNGLNLGALVLNHLQEQSHL